jgi:hypothetical protein
MTLSQIILANAAYVGRSNVTVTCNSSQSTVSIQSADGEAFLQGQEADEFNDEVERLYNEAGDVTMDDCRAHVAYDYVDTLV